MPRAYVIGALLPAGGTYMAYRLGCILHRYFGYELVDVEAAGVSPPLFDYPVPIPTVSLSEMDRSIRADDLLIANPSYSKLLFGFRLPARKIMYVQGFSSYSCIDAHFDLYVSASKAVQRNLSTLWGIESAIIPPFIQEPADMPPPLAWKERPPRSIAIYMKESSPDCRILHDYLVEKLRRFTPSVVPADVIGGRHIPHREFLERIGRVRYLVNLTLAEGFGLVPLEAMAMGTMVTGLDGLSGRDYMRSGENCLVTSFDRLTLLPTVINEALKNETLAQRCVEAGFITANQYRYGIFEAAWLRTLSDFLGVAPHHG